MRRDNITSVLIRALGYLEPAAPDIIDAESFGRHARRGILEGEIGLLRAVLQDGVDCYLKHLRAKDRVGRRKFAEAEEWIFEEREIDWLFSFENVCELLGFNPDFVRRGLLQRKLAGEGKPGKGAEARLVRKTA